MEEVCVVRLISLLTIASDACRKTEVLITASQLARVKTNPQSRKRKFDLYLLNTLNLTSYYRQEK